MYQSMIAVLQKDSAGWSHSFVRGLVAGCHRLGLPARMMVATEETRDTVASLLHKQLSAGQHPFLLDLNGRIGTSDAPKFSWVVDHPLIHPHLAEAGRRTVLGTIDSVHARLTGYSPAPATFMPHGGPEPDERPTPWAERDIDVLFVGNIPPARPLANPLEALAHDAGVQAGRAGTDPFDDLMAALDQRGLSLQSFSPDAFAHLLSIATDESQRVQRVAALLSVKSARLHVFGFLSGAWQAGLGNNATVHNPVDDFDEVCALMRRSRVVINLSSKFPHGSHERIWYAMACGAAVITNRSSFVERDFVHGENILYYDRPEDIGTLVDAALSHGLGARMVETARPIYQAGHTWEDRASRILSAMNRLAPST